MAALPLLDLPSPALLSVYAGLPDLRDSVALSLACKELHTLGAAARRRHLCCAACGHAVLQPTVALTSDAHRSAPPLRLPDGEAWAVEEQHALPGCRLGEERRLEMFEVFYSLQVDVGLHGALDDGYEVRAQELHCAGCGLHLGLRLAQLGSLRAGVAASCITNWRALSVLGHCFLPRRYLRLRAPDGREEHLGAPPPPADLALYRCTGARSPLRRAGEGCGALLLQARDVLSRQHCWDSGAGPERAWFVNALVPGSVAVRHERREELAQGPMVVADVHCCACGARIGWRFCADLEPAGLANCNQVGRYGVVRSSISVADAETNGGGSSTTSMPESSSESSDGEAEQAWA